MERHLIPRKSSILKSSIAFYACLSTTLSDTDYMDEIRYLNVDLIIQSRVDLTPIVNHFGDGIFVLHNGEKDDLYYAYLETAKDHSEPNEAIDAFCSLIETLGTKEKNIWENALSRTFDIGYESGKTPDRVSTDISPAVIERVAKCGAS